MFVDRANHEESTGKAGPTARGLTHRVDDMRPEEQLTVPLFGRPLTIGGEYSVESEYRRDFELENGAEDDLWKVDQELQLELLYSLRDNLALFVEVKPFFDADVYAEGGDRESDGGVKRGETWVYWSQLFGKPLGVQAGRQSFDEKREWWWDEDLDALRVYYYGEDPLHAELAAAEDLLREATNVDDVDPEKEDVLRVLGRVAWPWAEKNQLELFFLYQYDHSRTESEGDTVKEDREDESDADLTWIGARAFGRARLGLLGRLHYWLDTAVVWGDEAVLEFDELGGGRSIVDSVEKRDVLGWAVDGRITWETPWSWTPNLTLAYALGSGDSDLDDGTDRSFRQTDLQDNNGRFLGVNSFRYYGELLDPELSNLHVLTASLGFRFLQDSSVELLYHWYRQVHAADFLRDASINADPLGEDKAIGQEWDLVIGVEEWEHWELELTGALFRAGDAFGPLSGETATKVGFELNFNF